MYIIERNDDENNEIVDEDEFDGTYSDEESDDHDIDNV